MKNIPNYKFVKEFIPFSINVWKSTEKDIAKTIEEILIKNIDLGDRISKLIVLPNSKIIVEKYKKVK